MIKRHHKRNKSIDFKEHTLNTSLFFMALLMFFTIIELTFFYLSYFFSFVLSNFLYNLQSSYSSYLNKIEMTLKVRGQCILKLKVIHKFKVIHQDQGQIDYNCMLSYRVLSCF